MGQLANEVRAALEANGFTVVKHRSRSGWHAMEARPASALAPDGKR